MTKTKQTQERWRMVWDIPGACGTIRDQDDNDIAVVEIQPLDAEGDRVATLMVAAPQLLEALEAIVSDAQTGDWWCPTCQEWLPGSRVTYQECCDTCGTYVGGVNDPEWVEKAQAAIKAARGEQ